MWTKNKKVIYILYYLLAYWFPISSHSKIARIWRLFWAKKILNKCGKNVNIERFASFSPALCIGNNSSIGINSNINGMVTIGDNVMMGQDVIIYTTRHNDSRIDIPMREQGMKEIAPVVIGDDVWIGGRVIILPGVKIGNGCILGAGAVITKDIPPYSVAVGSPARVVKNRS